MKKIVMLLLALAISSSAFAKTTYIYTNRRMNFVKFESVKEKVAKELALTQPVTMSEEQMRGILNNIKLSRTFLIKKEAETQDVFDEQAVNFLAPKLVEALNMVTDRDVISFSYLSKNPVFIIRNDRITIARMWASDNRLHIVFEKLCALMTGDYDKRGDDSRLISKSRGLRVSLELRDGIDYGNTRDEIIVDLAHDFTKPATGIADAETTGEQTPAETSKTGKNGAEKAKTQIQAPAKPVTVRDRLKELEELKADGLITDKEYKKKKQDILKGL
ncbi:MAG: hypothetical protein COV46_06780 [Deltaproteobacteria bacterium CG11_big_fil_rev_8_21_14_0_20_49_13]|nr:MAG: hypothetical protein COV46_06780 [Deltaproteobacteria bacterium CG11_big_fil_rev_8_21_14_0_20_49_13]